MVAMCCGYRQRLWCCVHCHRGWRFELLAGQKWAVCPTARLLWPCCRHQRRAGAAECGPDWQPGAGARFAHAALLGNSQYLLHTNGAVMLQFGPVCIATCLPAHASARQDCAPHPSLLAIIPAAALGTAGGELSPRGGRAAECQTGLQGGAGAPCSILGRVDWWTLWGGQLGWRRAARHSCLAPLLVEGVHGQTCPPKFN